MHSKILDPTIDCINLERPTGDVVHGFLKKHCGAQSSHVGSVGGAEVDFML